MDSQLPFLFQGDYYNLEIDPQEMLEAIKKLLANSQGLTSDKDRSRDTDS